MTTASFDLPGTSTPWRERILRDTRPRRHSSAPSPVQLLAGLQALVAAAGTCAAIAMT